jgi:L-amino acid N-acyltransferase YncA
MAHTEAGPLNMYIRPAADADLPAILAIYNEAVLNTTATADYELSTLEARAAWYEERMQKGLPIFVAEEAGEIVGWSSLSPYHTRIGYRFTAEVSVYVAAEHRGQGVGKQLLPPLIEAGRARGLHVLVASIDSENDASIRLHTNNGFKTVGMLAEVYTKFGHWLGVTYMELRLSSEAAPPMPAAANPDPSA